MPGAQLPGPVPPLGCGWGTGRLKPPRRTVAENFNGWGKGRKKRRELRRTKPYQVLRELVPGTLLRFIRKQLQLRNRHHLALRSSVFRRRAVLSVFPVFCVLCKWRRAAANAEDVEDGEDVEDVEDCRRQNTRAGTPRP